MNASEFEAQLKADGYTEIETQDLAPRPGKGRHRHLFAIRGLVLSGTFIVTRDAPVIFRPGQAFEVAHGELHDESRRDSHARTARALCQTGGGRPKATIGIGFLNTLFYARGLSADKASERCKADQF